jgi:hypothetical protein
LHNKNEGDGVDVAEMLQLAASFEHASRSAPGVVEVIE